MSRPLNLAAIRLTGLHLIEASAGTGKTFAISNLVLRMILADGLGIDRILVLTFTTAATEELRERIGRRLREALAVIDGAPKKPDDVLAGLLADADPEQARIRLAEAITAMDQAAIHTIHGFCHRVLGDNAFETGAGFDNEMIQDESDLRRTAAEDLWRRRMGEADAEAAAWLLANWPQGPAGLLETLRPHLGPGELCLLPEPDDAGADPIASLRAWRERLLGQWPAARRDIEALLIDSEVLNRQSYSGSAVGKALAGLDALAAALPPELPEKFELLTPDKLTRSAKKGKTPPAHALFDLCGELDPADYAGQMRLRRACFLARARNELVQALAEAKEARRVLYFDDLLSRTAAALEGPGGAALAARLRAQYPRALIDEFQDTDPLQYRIFRRVYDGHDACGLFLIGDPKQAIYAFRGADIFTYMGARRHVVGQGADAAAGELWTLDTNWRSASALVRAVNGLFERAHKPFVYDADIPFEPVRSGPKADDEPLVVNDATPPALEFRWLPAVPELCVKTGAWLKANAAIDLAAADCADQVAALIAAGATGRARIGARPLAARDIAVLVRKHREGAAVRQALVARGIASVSIGQESVFASDEAAELSQLLAALADGAGEAAIRTALATRLLGWSASRIAALEIDEVGWDALLGRFDDYRRCWREQGFLTALWRLLHGDGVITRLRRLADGERRLTNLLHLAELAQLAAASHPGIDNLLRWLEHQRAETGGTGEETLLRLESDAELVRIVTLHKSKGLEFPVVFLPFPWSGGRKLNAKDPVPFHDDDGNAYLDLGSDDVDAHRAARDLEDLAEGLRLLYVGLTRAKHHCVVHWGGVNGAGASPAAYLLHPDPDLDGPADRMKDRDLAGLRAELAGLATASPEAIAVSDVPIPGAARVPAPPVVAAPPALSVRPFTTRIRDDWRLASFSGLAGGIDRERPDHDAATDAGDGEPPPPRPAPGEPIDPVFRFPRGIRAGHCLHGIFEELDFPQARGADLTATVERMLIRHGLDTTWTRTGADIVIRTLDTPLDGGMLRLRDVALGDRRTELEFHFAMDGARPAAIGRLLAEHGYPDIGLARLGDAALRGLMTGFIDLVFRRDGRFYIVDYKSNHLGDSAEHYAGPALEAAMVQHRYHLQYLIYCVALHRWLRLRLPDYDYDRHLGGVFYLFLRGLRPDQGPARGVWHDRPAAALIEALDAAFGTTATEAA